MASERPTPAPNEGPPGKERREIPAFSRQDALQARLAHPGENYVNINPANREIKSFSAETISPKATDSLIQQRSDEERRETAKGTVDSWKQTMVSHFSEQKTNRFFQESEKGKRFARAFQTAFDVDVTQFSADNATALYDQFCTVGEEKNGAIAYADKIIESYKNKSLKELEDDLDAFKWMGNILGEKTSEILVQRISMLKRTENDEGMKEFADTANTNNRINKPNDQEVTSLKFLYGEGTNLPTQVSSGTKPSTVDNPPIGKFNEPPGGTNSPEEPEEKAENAGETNSESSNETTARTEDTEVDQFIAENPLAVYDTSFPYDTVSSENIKVQLHGNQESIFPLTHIEGTSQDISTLIAPDKKVGQDAIGIKVRPDGVVNIALADGVSGTVLPAVAARLVRKTALEELDNHQPSSDVFRSVHDKLNGLDIPKITNEYIDSNKRQGEINTEANGKRRLDGLLAYAYAMENLRDQGALAATTLALGQYDRANNLLRVAVQGDSQVIIFKTDGTHRIITDPRNHQIDYQGQNAPYTPNGEIFEDIQLSHGDVILYTSDGAEKSYGGNANMLQELQAVVDSTRNTTGTTVRPDRALLLALKQKLKDAGISDDVSAIALHHI